jgi:hypothetical protein
MGLWFWCPRVDAFAEEIRHFFFFILELRTFWSIIELLSVVFSAADFRSVGPFSYRLEVWDYAMWFVEVKSIIEAECGVDILLPQFEEADNSINGTIWTISDAIHKHFFQQDSTIHGDWMKSPVAVAPQYGNHIWTATNNQSISLV